MARSVLVSSSGFSPPVGAAQPTTSQIAAAQKHQFERVYALKSFSGENKSTISSSTATNTPPHIPQGGPFQAPPANSATIQMGSATVMINGQAAARMGDTATTCNDPADLPVGTVVAAGTVMIG